MENMIIQATDSTPSVNFSTCGNLLLEGRAYPEDACRVFDPLIEFVSNLATEEVHFKVNLDYFNTAASKKILELFRALDENEKVQSVQINWHYEEEDEDSLDTAEIYADSLERLKFSYHELSSEMVAA